MPVNEGFIDPDGGRDVLDRRVLHPPLIEEGTGRSHDLALSFTPGLEPCWLTIEK